MCLREADLLFLLPVCATYAETVVAGELVDAARPARAVLMFVQCVCAVCIAVAHPVTRDTLPLGGLVVGAGELCTCAHAVG